MKTTVLPWPNDYETKQEYCKAVKPVMDQWKQFHARSDWKTPAQEWEWCNEQAKEWAEV